MRVEERILPFQSFPPFPLSAFLQFQRIPKEKWAAPWRAQPVGPDTAYEVRRTSVVVEQFS
jgi:hypothetical protein